MDEFVPVARDPSYLISKDGKVISAKYGRPQKIYTARNGYPTFLIGTSKTRKPLHVHRALAEAFISNPDNKRCVNHRDGNKQNNALDNLEWASHSENMVHAYQTTMQKGETHQRAKYSDETMREIQQTAHLLTPKEQAKIWGMGLSTVRRFRLNDRGALS